MANSCGSCPMARVNKMYKNTINMLLICLRTANKEVKEYGIAFTELILFMDKKQ